MPNIIYNIPLYLCVKESVNAENIRQSFKTNCQMYLNENIRLIPALTDSLKLRKQIPQNATI